MSFQPIFIILSFLKLINMAPVADLQTKLSICNFLVEKSVDKSEVYNANGFAGKLLMEFGQTAEQDGENAELDQCLAILYSKMNKYNMISFIFLIKDGESQEYKDQMEKMEYFLLHGRELIRTFFITERLKYSENYWTHVLEEYFHRNNTNIVNFMLDIEPDKWPEFMKTEQNTMELGGKNVEIKLRPAYDVMTLPIEFMVKIEN